MKREVLSVAGAGAVVLVLSVLGYVRVIALSDVSAALAYALVGSFFGILLWGFAPRIRRFVRGKTDENVAMPTPSQEIHWFSKFRRPPIMEEKRLDFWKVVIIMVMGGAIIIAIALSVPSESIPSNATFTFLIIKTTMISAGSLMILLSTYFTITELYAEWESRRHSSTECKAAYLNVLHAFDDSFRELKRVSQPKTKDIMLDDFEDKLCAICKLSWSDEIRSRIMEVLSYIPDKFSDDTHAKSYVGLLTWIVLSHIDEHTKIVVREKFLTELEKMMDDQEPHGECDYQVLITLGILHEYSVEYLMELVDDATYQWSTKKFNTLVPDVTTEFYGLRHRDREVYREFYSRLDRKMEKAEKIGNEQAFDRLRTLHDRAKTILEAR